MSELQAEINTNVTKLTDTEILRRRNDKPELRRRTDKISEKFKEFSDKLTMMYNLKNSDQGMKPLFFDIYLFTETAIRI